MPICKLCLKDRKLIDAHIIPRGFYNHLYPNKTQDPGASKKALMVLRAKGKNTNSWIGEYDKNILCAQCDNQFGVYDEYAQTIFLRTTPKLIHERAMQIASIDFKKMKLFFMSLLWRASISTRDFFHMVEVGSFEDELRKMLIENDVGNENDFTIILSKFSNSNPKLEQIKNLNITTPLYIDLPGSVRAYVFYFPNGYKTYIKADKKSFPEALVKACLKPNMPVLILDAGEFENSSEFKKMAEVVYKDHHR